MLAIDPHNPTMPNTLVCATVLEISPHKSVSLFDIGAHLFDGFGCGEGSGLDGNFVEIILEGKQEGSRDDGLNDLWSNT
jgi:hypothetical protein